MPLIFDYTSNHFSNEYGIVAAYDRPRDHHPRDHHSLLEGRVLQMPGVDGYGAREWFRLIRESDRMINGPYFAVRAPNWKAAILHRIVGPEPLLSPSSEELARWVDEQLLALASDYSLLIKNRFRAVVTGTERNPYVYDSVRHMSTNACFSRQFWTTPEQRDIAFGALEATEWDLIDSIDLLTAYALELSGGIHSMGRRSVTVSNETIHFDLSPKIRASKEQAKATLVLIDLAKQIFCNS